MDMVDRKLDKNIEHAQMAISSIIAEKGELSTEVANLAALPQVTIHDREYLETKTKGMIARCEAILDRLEQSFDTPPPDESEEGKDKKSGFSLYAIDVYAKIVNAVAVQVRELRELNKMVMGIDAINAEQVIKQQEEKQAKNDKTVKMTSSDLLKLIQEAGKKTEVNAVPAEYEEVPVTADTEGASNGKNV